MTNAPIRGLLAVVAMALCLARIPAAAVTVDTGGQIKSAVSATCWPQASLQDQLQDTAWIDASTLLRLKSRLFFSDRVNLDIHYLSGLSGGDTRKHYRTMARLLSGTGMETPNPGSNAADRTSLLDLSSQISQGRTHTLSHSLDRLALEITPSWGTVILGRQAVTWGNGLVFNPMDLCNPFAPSDITRDYKQGADMALIRIDNRFGGDIQILAVPRRDPDTRDVSGDNSSLAIKTHLFSGRVEIDLMAASHRSDLVFGAGMTGFAGGAAWRTDAVCTRSGGDKDENFISIAANLDYSWTFLEKNMYGFLECYYTGLGSGDTSRIYTDLDIYQRMEAGDIFTTGSLYLACHASMEIHPLFNLSVSTITNIQDGSGLIQPRAIWNLSTDMELTLGAALCHGGAGEEFGTITLPGTALSTGAGSNLFVWLTRFF